MAKRKKEYQKLPGYKKGFLLGKHTLWRGTDHLLQIFSRMGAEDYKRFYFSDIQAIITRKTPADKVQNAILGCFILFLALPAFFFGGGGGIFFAVAAGMLLILLVINLFRGPTCETLLMTAVQTEKMHSLHRLKNTLRVLNRLKPHIQNVQGVLSAEDLKKVAVQSVRNKTPNTRSKTIGLPKIPLRHEKGRMHMILFVLLVFDGLLSVTGFFSTHVITTLLSSINGICMGIFVIIALVKQHNSDLSGPLKAVTWTSLGYVGIAFIAGYVVSFMYFFKNPGMAYNQWEFFKSLSAMSPWESPLRLGFDIYTICGAIFLGTPGLFFLKKPANVKKKIVVAKPGRPLDSGSPLPG
jgi:hypothetical protein